MSESIENAFIEYARIRFDRGVFLTCWIGLNFGGSGQGYGGYVFAKEGEAPDSAFGLEVIQRIMEMVGVEEWNDLVGRPVRVKRQPEGIAGKIVAVGHFTKDKWVSMQDLADKYYPKEQAS